MNDNITHQARGARPMVPARNTEVVTTADLHAGDTVRHYGVRLLIDREPESCAGPGGATVYTTRALITDPAGAAVLAEADPYFAGVIVNGAAEGRVTVQSGAREAWVRILPAAQ